MRTDFAPYAAALLRELGALARAYKLRDLAFLLAMAELQASEDGR